MEPDRLHAFELMMSGTPRIWLGGIIAYGISQILNVTIFSALKSGGGRLLWLRAAIASVLSQIAEHAAYGGVVPEIAARAHVEVLDRLIARALDRAGLR
ncbi:VUT family protein, partial [Enterobacter hormaechei]|uniref:VUT family protein n=1 Tax=Enterobacter hormaechei TaxID=158836 RepID=UPI001EF91E08